MLLLQIILEHRVINFNNVKDGALTIESSPIWTGHIGVDEFGGIINAVDIDWNGAQITN